MPCVIGSTQNSVRHGSGQLLAPNYGGRRYGSSRVLELLMADVSCTLATTAGAWGQLHPGSRRSTATKYVAIAETCVVGRRRCLHHHRILLVHGHRVLPPSCPCLS